MPTFSYAYLLTLFALCLRLLAGYPTTGYPTTGYPTTGGGYPVSSYAAPGYDGGAYAPLQPYSPGIYRHVYVCKGRAVDMDDRFADEDHSCQARRAGRGTPLTSATIEGEQPLSRPRHTLPYA